MQDIENYTGTPENLFHSIGLAIDIIEGVSIAGAGRVRKLSYAGKEHWCPEVLARAFYEELGYISSWSEGLALQMVFDAIEELLKLKLLSHLRTGDIKQELLETAQNREKKSNETWQKLVDLNPERAKNGEPSINLVKKLREKASKEQREGISPIDLSAIVYLLRENSLERAQEYIDSLPTIRSNLNIEELAQSFKSQVSTISESNDKNIIKKHINKLTPNDNKSDRTNFFRTDYTYEFALEIVEFCTPSILMHEYLASSGLACRFDLTLINKDTRKFRYIEVKLDDGLTKAQLRDMPNYVKNNLDIGLCVLKRKKD